jgi:hypothetical protein
MGHIANSQTSQSITQNNFARLSPQLPWLASQPVHWLQATLHGLRLLRLRLLRFGILPLPKLDLGLDEAINLLPLHTVLGRVALDHPVPSQKGKFGINQHHFRHWELTNGTLSQTKCGIGKLQMEHCHKPNAALGNYKWNIVTHQMRHWEITNVTNQMRH